MALSLICLLLSMLLTSCMIWPFPPPPPEKVLPPFTSEGKQTAGFYCNDTLWVASWSYARNPPVNVIFYPVSTIAISLRDGLGVSDIKVSAKINFKPKKGYLGRYMLKQKSEQKVTNYGTLFFDIDDYHLIGKEALTSDVDSLTNHLDILYYNEEKGIMSGIFQLKAMQGSRTFNITQGRFDFGAGI